MPSVKVFTFCPSELYSSIFNLVGFNIFTEKFIYLCEGLGNTFEVISEIPIYIPKASMTNDVIIVSDDNPSEYPSLSLPVWLKIYSPALL
jgi:hypothetical protein